MPRDEMSQNPAMRDATMQRASDASKLETLVRERIDDWRAGDEPDAARLLADHPELLASKSLVLDLGLAEFSLRSAAGDGVGRDSFCDSLSILRPGIHVDRRSGINREITFQSFISHPAHFMEHSHRLRLPEDRAALPGHGDGVERDGIFLGQQPYFTEVPVNHALS